jgi:hypothetical protein
LFNADKHPVPNQNVTLTPHYRTNADHGKLICGPQRVINLHNPTRKTKVLALNIISLRASSSWSVSSDNLVQIQAGLVKDLNVPEYRVRRWEII